MRIFHIIQTPPLLCGMAIEYVDASKGHTRDGTYHMSNWSPDEVGCGGGGDHTFPCKMDQFNCLNEYFH